MARRLIAKHWTEEDIARLVDLFEANATLLRAAAALNRSQQSVRTKARQLGKTFPGVRKVHAGLIVSGAREPRMK